jgi:hypothetical protein
MLQAGDSLRYAYLGFRPELKNAKSSSLVVFVIGKLKIF